MSGNPERRYDRYGEFRWMTEAEGYVMCRRKGCGPFVLTRREWDALARRPELVDKPDLLIVK